MSATVACTRVYCKGHLESHDFPLAEVSDHLQREDTFVWIDFCQPTEADMHEVAEELGLHELAVEDAVGPHQRPKLDHYEDHMFFACHAVSLDADAGELRSTEVDAFIGDRWLVTVRKDDGFDMGKVRARCDRSRNLAKQGVGYLLYSVLDVVVDGYFSIIDVFDEYYDGVGDEIFNEHPILPSQQRRWFEMRRALMRFHRLVAPLREAVGALMRRDNDFVSDALNPYFQDVYDHVLRVTESSDRLRELVGTIVETNLGLRDYRTNQIMKKVTSWAGIIAVPTLITGYYGMNVPFPGDGKAWGVWMSASLLVVLTITLYSIFRRKGWL